MVNPRERLEAACAVEQVEIVAFPGRSAVDRTDAKD